MSQCSAPVLIRLVNLIPDPEHRLRFMSLCKRRWIDMKTPHSCEEGRQAPDYRRVCHLLRRMGVTPNLPVSIRRPGRPVSGAAAELMLSLSKWLYPLVAREMNTTGAAVERNIRTVILRAWRQNPELLRQCARFRSTKTYLRGVPGHAGRLSGGAAGIKKPDPQVQLLHYSFSISIIRPTGGRGGALKLSVQKYVYNALGHVGTDDPGTHGQHVGVVMAAGHFGGVGIAAQAHRTPFTLLQR